MLPPELDSIENRLRFVRAMAGLGAGDAIARVHEVQRERGQSPIARRTFFAHERGSTRHARKPDGEIIAIYAEAYGVSPAMISEGEGLAACFAATDAETKARVEAAMQEVARAIARRARLAGDDEETEDANKINQQNNIFESESSQNLSSRHIAILSTGTLKELKSWAGDLTNMSDETTPAPDARAQFAYTIHGDDFAMVGRDRISFHPGTLLHIKPDAPIPPDSYVLADIDGFDQVLFRVYEAARPYQPGVPFTLRALNPAYQPILIPEAGACLKLGLVIGAYMPLIRW